MKTIGLVVVVAVVTAAVTTAVTRRYTAPASAPALQTPNATVQEIMEGLVDPSSKVIFESVGVVSNASGTTELAPQSPEQWAHVERSAMMLAEAANLLALDGRHVERPGAEPDAGHESSPELPPEQIEARINSDRAAWLKHADALRAIATHARDVATTRNVQGLFDVGAELDVACENCHQAYWYNAPDGVRVRR